MAANPCLQKLLKLLEKPNTLRVAEKMIKFWTNNNSIECVQRSSCVCSLLKTEYINVCQSFHWSCILKYLTRKTTYIDNHNIIVTTQFASHKLSEHFRIQFLTLLINIHSSLPSHNLCQFIQETEQDLKTDTWTHYLLQKLRTLTVNVSSQMGTPIVSHTSDTIVNTLSGGNRQTHVTTCHNKRKRKVVEEVIILEDTSKAKHAKLSPLNGDTSITASPNTATAPVLKEIPVCVNQSEEETLPTEIKLAIDEIKSAWNEGQKVPDECFLSVISLPFDQFEKCLLKLETSTESETMATICNMTSEVEMNFQYQVLCMHHLIAPYFLTLQKTVSRPVITSLISIIRKYPLSSMDGLMYPLLQLTKSFSKPQSQLVCKLVQEMTDEQRNYIWKKVVLTKETINGELYIWNNHLIEVFQSLIDKGVSFDGSSSVTNFVKLLQINSGHHTKTLIFASFLVKLLTNYNDEFREQKNVLSEIIEGHQTSLKKKLLILRDNL